MRENTGQNNFKYGHISRSVYHVNALNAAYLISNLESYFKCVKYVQNVSLKNSKNLDIVKINKSWGGSS